MKKEKLEEVYSNNINFNKIIKTNINNSYKNKSKKIFSISKKIIRNFHEKKLLKNLKHILKWKKLKKILKNNKKRKRKTKNL